ncbi:uncharacterized protein LOC132047695 [Lycium ferocissimum]|uniref:uncharacterized protein LOC132047695 n=1 Tax=Lycium ferocissimum TaxID=112874 RepID=UPI002814A97C|nr:uncharacterized protein LOC132047695 [Lycium ferocissimum]
MIPLFFNSTGFYGKRDDVDWKNNIEYIEKGVSDPLDYVFVENLPEQDPESNDCGVYVCAFAEYISQGILEIPKDEFDHHLHRSRYGALLWDYARMLELLVSVKPTGLVTEIRWAKNSQGTGAYF